MPENDKPDTVDRLVDAYDRMLKATHDAVAEAQKETVPRMREILEKARDQVVEFGELTREEGAKVADYLERDIKDAASYIASTGEDLRAWWQFDLKLMEKRMLDMFTSVADQTSIQLREWAEQARQSPAYRTGEITGPGSLICEGCGEGLTFVKAGRIPACPKCGGTGFKRETGPAEPHGLAPDNPQPQPRPQPTQEVRVEGVRGQDQRATPPGRAPEVEHYQPGPDIGRGGQSGRDPAARAQGQFPAILAPSGLTHRHGGAWPEVGKRLPDAAQPDHPKPADPPGPGDRQGQNAGSGPGVGQRDEGREP